MAASFDENGRRDLISSLLHNILKLHSQLMQNNDNIHSKQIPAIDAMSASVIHMSLTVRRQSADIVQI